MSNETKHEADGYDLFSDEYRGCPHKLWEQVRSSGCPVAHSDQWGGSWLLTSYEDVHQAAHDHERFSSRTVDFAGPVPAAGRGFFSPPITSDPPEHTDHRNLLEPFFTPAKIAEMEPFARQTARELVEALVRKGGGDAAVEFAKPLALAVLARLLQVPDERKERFMDWAIRVIKLGPLDQALRSAAFAEAFADLTQLLEERTQAPGDDLVSYIARAEINGEPLSQKHRLGTLLMVVLAGADTTWSSISSSLLHLAQHPADRAKLVAHPELLRTTAVEELLRAYAPVTIGRITATEVELHDRTIGANERVLLTYPAANRDPAVFDNPDTVDLERKRNRHLTFGTGVHRCLGAHLARMELRVGVSEWLSAMPNFRLAEGEITWSSGQVRGPEHVHVVVEK